MSPIEHESESSNIPSSFGGDDYQKSQMHQSSPLPKTNVSANSIQLNDMCRSIEKIAAIKDQNFSQLNTIQPYKRKGLQNLCSYAFLEVHMRR